MKGVQFEVRKSMSKEENEFIQKQLKERKIFFNKLDQKLVEADLLAYFKRYGAIDEVKLLRNVKTQLSRRCGFILFKNVKDKNKALRKKWHAINGKKFTIEDCINKPQKMESFDMDLDYNEPLKDLTTRSTDLSFNSHSDSDQPTRSKTAAVSSSQFL